MWRWMFNAIVQSPLGPRSCCLCTLLHYVSCNPLSPRAISTVDLFHTLVSCASTEVYWWGWENWKVESKLWGVGRLLRCRYVSFLYFQYPKRAMISSGALSNVKSKAKDRKERRVQQANSRAGKHSQEWGAQCQEKQVKRQEKTSAASKVLRKTSEPKRKTSALKRNTFQHPYGLIVE